MSDELAEVEYPEKIILPDGCLTMAQIREVVETIKLACIEAVKEEPETLPTSDSFRHGFVRGIRYAVSQIEKIDED